jgi:CTP synthase (UTP-ammonia lyase)
MLQAVQQKNKNKRLVEKISIYCDITPEMVKSLLDNDSVKHVPAATNTQARMEVLLG